MNPFRYTRATNTASAIKFAESHPDAVFLAGGTTLIDLMKADVEHPPLLLDIRTLPLAEITGDGSVLRIGALASNTAVAVHPIVMERFPVLSQALLSGASAQIRNMATIGGNLLQRTRCPYFRDTALPCNKRNPGSGCGALYGYNRGHAVLGTSVHCIATHPSDMAVALSALDATILLVESGGERRVPVREFYKLPGSTPHLETVLRHGELIAAIELRYLQPGSRSAYRKVRDRASYEFALSSAAVALCVNDGRIAESRIALGGVGTVPWHAAEAEKVLHKQTPDRRLFVAAANAALAGASTFKHNAFKVELAKRTLVETLSEVAGLHA